ncbi:hypothetical protein [Mesorhizobium sp. M1E.F.Ca.ET.063.01.1.1]|uniref:hypothetical protein n=1 Tax=Mesorhizobium sp. M1E.F.Ca.ET.063.01.1.1 TaxID=2496750 RepID=UPI000FC9BB1E|nr:hypothetical protein [Mesorhizobium sp. M1E.F.Ca.ET.063.01.1.1]RUW85310.1 hypothetical protein EOA29_05445 [Mesorhizobium sp. M1E.F.Ca.ET.063.01.1.1]
MDPNAILIMTSVAFVAGLISWALPAWKYHKQTNVGVFAGALLAAGIIFMSMFKWTDVALEIAGAKIEIKVRDQKISELQAGLAKAETALAQVEEKAPDTTELASSIQEAMKKAGYTVDQSTVKSIATDSLKPLQTYFKSPEWNSTKLPAPQGGAFKSSNPDTLKYTVPGATPLTPEPSTDFEKMVIPNKTN